MMIAVNKPGLNAPFPLFGWAHLAILSAVPTISVMLAGLARKYRATAPFIRYSLAAFSFFIGLSWYAYRYIVLNIHPPFGLPLELCDFALWTAVASLLTRNLYVRELTYFVGLPAAAMALLTPNLTTPLASFPSFTFLCGHAAIVISVLFLLWSGEGRVRASAWRVSFLSVFVLTISNLVVDKLYGTNYMFLVHKPDTPSLLDVMGPWPWYIVAGLFVAFVILWGLSLPFRTSSTAVTCSALNQRSMRETCR
jgi:hypothetical integral membrane protein (TIGR02206 family)